MTQPVSLFVLGSFVVACSAKVARLPRPGECLQADAFAVEPGGKGFNLALGAHRLGARVDGLFAIGNDLFSQLAPSTFTQLGLSTAMLRRFEGSTGSGIGFTDPRGETFVAVHQGANRLLSSHEIESVEQSLREADLVLAQFEIGDEPIREAFAVARAAGRKTLLNPSPYRAVESGILRDTSILVLNRIEAAELALAHGLGGAGEVEQREGLAGMLLERGPEIVVVTLDGDGATAYRRGEPALHQAAFPVEVIDSLGAGDAFTAGLAVSLMEGRPLSSSLARAAACGAMVCRGIGVVDLLPSAHELACFLEGYEDAVLVTA